MRERTLLLVFLFLVPAVPALGSQAQRCVAVLSTSDIHGAVEPHEIDAGTKQVRFGGMLVLASYVAALREAHAGRVVLLDAGDMYQGSLVSNLSHGRAMIAAMGAVGYDAAALGNHEFDFGAGPAAAGGAVDVLAVVKARVAEARFPVLAANMFEKATRERPRWTNLRDAVLIERGGVRIGIVGAITPETPRVARPQYVSSLEFADPAPHVAAAARALRQGGAELVVLAAHLGGFCERTDDPHDLSSCERDGEIFSLLGRLPPGTVDVAVGGHTHSLLAHWVNGVAVTQAGARARALGYVEACVAPGGGIDRAASRIHVPVPLCLDAWSDGTCGAKPAGALGPAVFLGKTMAPSRALVEVLAPYREEVREAAARRIGARLLAPLPVSTPGGGSPLGDVVLEAMREAGRAPIAVQNRGGIRADLPAGELTYSKVFEAIPFDNRVAVLELTAEELTAFVRHFLGRKSPALVAGLRVPAGGAQAPLSLADGTPLEPGRRYRVATNDYLALGGEGLHRTLAGVAPENVRILDVEIRDALVEHLRRRFGGAGEPRRSRRDGDQGDG